GGSSRAEIACPPKSATLYWRGRKTSHSTSPIGTSIFGRDNSAPPFFPNGVPACRNTYEIVLEPYGWNPARNSGTRFPSAPCTGFTFSPATSAQRLLL